MDDKKRCPIPHPELLSRSVDDELVIVRPADGQIRVLNSVGALVWRSMDGKRTISDIANLVCAEYQVSLSDAAGDIQCFLDPLVKDGMVAWTGLEDE
jgi:hypothetical protein